MNVDLICREGGAGCKGVLILEGKCTLWVMDAPDTKRWDTCAVEALLTASGGFVTNVNGQRYDYSAAAASAPRNVNGVIAGLGQKAMLRVSNLTS